MTDAFTEHAQLLHTESDRFTRYLQALPPQTWSQSTACDQWQVQDVVAHLIEVAQLYTHSVTRGVQGDAEPPEGRLPAGAVNASIVAERVAQRSIATRKRLGDELLETFEHTGAHLNRLFAELSPEDRDKPCYHPGGIVPARRFIDLRLKELAMHEWDMRSPHESGFTLSRPCLPAILGLMTDSIASGSLRWGFWAGSRLSAPVRYRVELTDPFPFQTDLVVEGDQVRVETAAENPAQVMMRCDAETFVLLVYGRLPLTSALDSGRLIAEGDADHTAALASWFRGV
ncbi:MAG: maleylpyruvate isomerase family mycothiol-dependent enzyme [Candidatus Tectomicrobia bacterium]|nr:maleylpyruvate isomerase family mycothiol-dependent enzyme [Candidatus Tectomicrobia bacterium]